jgi:hypothetical protein
MTWEPTNELRWLHRPTSDGVGGAFIARILQQKWVKMKSFGEASSMTEFEWRDVPEVTEEGGA